MRNVILIIVFFLFGLGIGFFLLKPASDTSSVIVECESSYEYINKHLGCGDGPVIAKHGYSELSYLLSEYIEEKKSDGVVESVSIYFRDLENGPSFGISEYETFIPASLFKLPIMFAYLLLVDEEDFDLSQQIAFGERGEGNVSRQFFPPKEEAQAHTPYSFEDLIFRMTAYSDNKATAALVSELGNLSNARGVDLVNEAYKSTGIVYPNATTDAVVTTKSYSSLFRMLYNSTLLSNEMSEKALEMMGESDFDKGLVAGVPDGIEIAHKFGERFDENIPDDVEQFHDCGIVYYPENPYLLCVMTKGKYIPTQVEMISEISKMVYSEVDSRKISE